MRKALKILVGVAVFCAWGFAVMQLIMPSEMVDFRIAVTNLLQGNRGELFTIEDQRSPLAGPARETGVADNGWLRVESGTLVNDQGEPFQLRGMSSHGLAWYYAYTSKAALQTTKAYGANLFRVAMYVDDQPGNYTRKASDQRRNTRLMHKAIDNTLSQDMYVIADWHVLEDANPLERVDCAVAFFEELSAKYGQEAGVLYEICNEPNGDTTWEDIVKYASQVIPVIRANAPDAVIIVGTPAFATDLWSAIEAPLAYDNVAYAYHYYSGIAADGYVSALEAAAKAGLPVFVSEWGVGAEEEALNPEQLQRGAEFVAYLDAHNISWANWSLSNKEEAFSAIRANVRKLSEWTWEDMTPSGLMVFQALLQTPDSL